MRWILGALLVTATFTGCLGVGGGDESVEPAGPTAQSPPGEGEAAIAGTVTDTAIQPVAGASVSVPSLDVSTQTDDQGSFRLDSVPPGTYQVSVRATDYLPAQQEVDASAGETSTVDFVLTRMQENKPFKQTFELQGFMEYGWAVGANLTQDAVWVRDTNCDYDEIAGPNCRGNFMMEPPLNSIVFEMEWTPSNPVGDSLYAMMRVADNASVITGEWEIFSIEGESPLYLRMDRSDLDEVVEEFDQRCEDGEDQFCGLNFRDKGWPMQTRVWPGWQCPNDQAGFCPVLQQDYTQYVTAFYHAPAPEGYSVVEGNTPEVS